MTMPTSLTSSGFNRARLDEIFASLVAQVQDIYGADIVLDGSTQDGQLLGVFAEAISDLSQVVEDVYASFDPSAATGQALFRLGLLNGITAQLGQQASVTLSAIIKQGETMYAGTQIQDVDTGVIYLTNATVGPSVSDAHVYSTTATAQLYGTVQSAAGKVSRLVVPVFGVLSVTNPSPSTTGTSPETQEAFRQRRNASVAAPAQGILDGLYGALANIPAIGHVQVFNNPTAEWASIKTGDLALPPHSVRVVVQNDQAAIASTIWKYKSPGCGYYGDTPATVTDSQGNLQATPYTVATAVQISVEVAYRVVPGQGFVESTDGDKIKAAVSAWIADNQIPGQNVTWSYLFAPILASVPGKTAASAISVEQLFIKRTVGGTLTAFDLPLDWDEIATCPEVNVTLSAMV